MNPQGPLTRDDHPSTNTTVAGGPPSDAFTRAPKLSAAPSWSLRYALAAPFVKLAAVLVYLVVATVALTITGAAPSREDKTGQLVLAAACTVAAGLATLWLVAVWRHKRVRPRLADFALVCSPRRPGAVIGWTLGTGAAVVLAMGVYARLVPARQDAAQAVHDAHGAQLAALVLLTVVLAPVNEEVLCRCVVYGGLRSWRGPWCAVPVSALVWALPHADWKLMPLLVAVGIALAVVREQTGSLAPTIALHSALNAAAVSVYSPLLTAALAGVMLTVCGLIALQPPRRRLPASSHQAGVTW
ncbi:hypothetical protein GCM10022254_57190 [Actinomadura meridiana]|uniref:CAAX prenyl protease 2/Lysostaphin resistance protein A-like domain-containing protein n=1 Tax=Actinomadura meridiana TaxID=559626 RepID=A0ABP8CH55_9ACTN